MENISFKASFTPALERKVAREIVAEGFDKELKYLNRLARRLKELPEGTIDIIKKEINHIRVTKEELESFGSGGGF